jgi:SAM-dependent methyltransferase
MHEHSGYRALKRVTSDCKPWKADGRLYTCTTCGTTQVACDSEWRKAIDSIYRDYTIYYQGGGEEQKVFDSNTGRSLPRSEWLLECIDQNVRMPAAGMALDVGCGNGRFLKAFGSRHSAWKLSGTEFDDKYRDIVEQLPGVDKLHTAPLRTIPERFNFISLIHVLEHIENPVPFLTELKTKLLPDGLLFVELPSYDSNPFELLIVDHASHYTLQSIGSVLNRSGYACVVSSDAWVAKEISVLARTDAQDYTVPPSPIEKVERTIAWLGSVASQARQAVSAATSFGIFGTSIAATWLVEEIGVKPVFFVDEDENRAGHSHLGAPIYLPKDVPAGSTVFVAQETSVAQRIAKRLSSINAQYLCPDQ